MTATPSYESIADVEAAAQKMRDFFLTGATRTSRRMKSASCPR